VTSPLARVRRPADLARLLVVIAIGALVFAAGNLAAQTTTGLQSDIVQATRLLPTFILLALTAIGGTFAVLLPAALVMLGLLERKIRLVLEAHLAAIVAIAAAIAANSYLAATDNLRLIAIFIGSNSQSATPINTLLAATLALALVLRLTERKFWSIATITISVLLGWSTVLAGSATLVAQLISAIGGICAGLIVRILLGTPSTRPSIAQLISEIPEFGLTESDLTAETATKYHAVLPSGKHITLEILDRDSDGAGFIASIYRTMRLRGIESGSGLAMRPKVERLMLANLAARNAGVNTKEMYAVKEINADAIVILRERIEATAITAQTPGLDQVLATVWQQLARLHQADIAHRNASLDSFVLQDGKVIVRNLDTAVIASSKLLMALDIAELLLATTQVVGAKRAVEIAIAELSKPKVFYAARLLQPIAMSAASRANLRTNKSSLSELRSELAHLGIDPDVEQLDIQRLRPRTLLLLTLSVAAGYAVLNQLAEVNLVNIFSAAQLNWILIAIAFSAITYIGATFALTAFITTKVNWLRAFIAQLAGSFLTLVTPPAVGAVTVNVRFLQRNGLTPGAAGATVAMSQITMFGTHILMLIAVSVIAGTSAELSFSPPRWLILAITAVAFSSIFALTIPLVRNWLLKVTANFRNQMLPALVKVISEPRRLIFAMFGAVGMNLAYILCLAASIRAFGDSTALITVAFIYLAGATLGSLAPTPGGLGAVEAVLVAALTAGGLPAATAISVTLLYRLVTFWLPVLPGWLGFNYLTRKESL
jgi:uncharacterized protein (TIRG00374 family)